MTTAEALESITDRGLFERLATSVLRKKSKDYEAVVQVGINAAGETIVSPIDGFCLIPHSAPSHYILIEHTTTDASGLEAKWLLDHTQVKPRVSERKKKLTDADDGDLLKAGRLAHAIRDSEPDATFTVILSTNQRVNVELQRKVYSEAQNLQVNCDIWEQSRYADFLDNTRDGHWLRKHYLGIEAELISTSLLKELCERNLASYANEFFNDPNARICRYFDADINDRIYRTGCSILFLVGESGFGKSVSAYAALKSHLERGGFGLWIPPQAAEQAVSLAGAIDVVLRDLYPSLQCNAGQIALRIDDQLQFLIVVDDINRTTDVNATAHRLASWSKPQLSSADLQTQSIAHTILCPIWPLGWAPLNHEIGQVNWVKSISIGVMEPDEARFAMKLTVSAAGVEISDHQADALANRVGYDPMLVGLLGSILSDCAHADLFSVCDNVIERFVETQINRVTSRSQSSLLSQDYTQSLVLLAKHMLMNRKLHPLWEEIQHWLSGNPNAENSVRELIRQGSLCRIANNGQFVFRHDRIRDYFLVAGMVSLFTETSGIPQVVTDPFFAGIIGKAIVRSTQEPDILAFLRENLPLALIEAIRSFGEADSDYEHAIVNEAICWAKTTAETDNVLESVQNAVVWSLLETDSTAVLQITESFKSYPLVNLARLRNGDALSGALFCISKHGLAPAINDRLRDRIIEHALRRHSKEIQEQLTELLQSESIDDVVREGVFALAGFIASQDLTESISFAWELVEDKDRLFPEALWAACRCHGSNIDGLLSPILEQWSHFPDDEDNEPGVTSKMDIALQLGWALSRGIDTDIIQYLIKQSIIISTLDGPITVILEQVDHPDAIEFIARKAAEVQERTHNTNSFSPWVMNLRQNWDISLGASHGLSSDSLARLQMLWQDPHNNDFIRQESFRLWQTGANKTDLDQLKAIQVADILFRAALWKRALLGDETVIPELTKIVAKETYWFDVAHHVWCSEVMTVAQQHLSSFKETIPTNFSGGRLDPHYHLSKLLMEIPAEDAEKMLFANWNHLRYSPLFIQTALYIGTAKCSEMVALAISEWPQEAPLFGHIGMIYGIMVRNKQDRLTAAHFDRLVPYLDRMPDNELAHFADGCQRIGIPEWGQEYIVNHLSEESRKRYYPSDANLLSELDEMASDIRHGTWRTRYWLKDFDKRHDSRNRIISLLDRWLAANPTARSLEIVCSCIAIIGMRSDLSLLTKYHIEGTPEVIAHIIADTQFRVFLRSLD